MNKQELIEKLKEQQGPGDRENQHHIADNLLLSYINDPEIKEAYDNVDKWYA